MTRVLVTGATGFTGGELVRRLREAGHEVLTFVRPSSNVAKLREYGAECRTVDIRDARQVRDAFEPVSVVYHMAAAFRLQHPDPMEFERVNVDGTLHLLESAVATGAGRFVHCSTVGVQGGIDDPPATEEYRASPGDMYQETKWRGEQLARSFHPRLPVVVVRPVGIYGPGDLRFLKLFRSIARRRFVMIGSGEVLYHLTHVDDVVRGLLLAGSKPEALGEVFTIAGERYTTLHELVGLIAEAVGAGPPRIRIPYAPVLAASVVCDRVWRAFGASPPLYPRRVHFFSKDRAFDISKARSLLDYAPRVGLEEGLGRTAEWYRQEGLL